MGTVGEQALQLARRVAGGLEIRVLEDSKCHVVF
jgi:hypothetical protein